MGYKKNQLYIRKLHNAKIYAFHFFLYMEYCASLGLVLIKYVIAQTTNCMISEPLINKYFRDHCTSFSSECKFLLYYSYVRWLSRGKFLEENMTLEREVGIHFIFKS